MATDPIVVVDRNSLAGMRAFLKSVDKTVQKEINRPLNQAARLVVNDVRPTVPLGLTGQARRSVTVNNARIPGVRFGGVTAPYYPWLDFGGSTGPGHRPGVANSGSVKRSRVHGGRYMYPGIERNEEAVREAVGDWLGAIIDRSG